MSSTEPALVRVVWEHTHRELLPTVLLLSHLEQAGTPWVLDHVYAIGGVDRPEIVLMPFFYATANINQWLYRAGVDNKVLVNLAYEQMHLRCARGYLLPDGAFARESMLHCTWGERFRGLLIEHGVPDERIRLTGHPRFDIYHHPSLLMTRSEMAQRWGLREDRPWLLVPGSFNLAYISERHRRLLNRGGYQLTREMMRIAEETRDAFIALLGLLTRRFPEVDIILRVHPAGYEVESLYRIDDGRGQPPNLHVIREYDIANWITQAALVIVWNSTSSMEALVAGTPVMSYEPIAFSEPYGYDVNRIIPTVTEAEAVAEIVDSLPDPRLSYDWELFESWYRYRDGDNTARLAATIAEASEHFEQLAARVPDTPGIRSRRRRASVAARMPRWVRRHVFGFKDPRPNPPSPQLAEAIASCTSSPLSEFLK